MLEEATRYKTINGKRYKLWGSFWSNYDAYWHAEKIADFINASYGGEAAIVKTKEGYNIYYTMERHNTHYESGL